MLRFVLNSNIALGTGMAVGIVLTDPSWLDGTFPPLALGLVVGLVAGFVYGLNWATRDASKLVWSTIAFLVTMRKFLKTDGICGIADVGGLTGTALVGVISAAALCFCVAGFWRHGQEGAAGAALAALLLAKFVGFLAFPNSIEVDVGVGLTTITLTAVVLLAGFALTTQSALTFVQYLLSGALAVATLLIYLALVAIPICGDGPERILLVAVAFLIGWVRPALKLHRSGFGSAMRYMLGPSRGGRDDRGRRR